MAKLKQYGFTHYIRNVEVYVICVTTSKQKFADLLDIKLSQIKDYMHINDAKNVDCINNPNKLFVQRGMGGEALAIFKKDKTYSYEEAQEIINKHREVYKSRGDWYNSLID